MYRKHALFYSILFLVVTKTFCLYAEELPTDNSQTTSDSLLNNAQQVFWVNTPTYDYYTGCCGYYDIPSYTAPEANKPLENAKLFITADHANYLNKSELNLSGNVKLNMANLQITTEKAAINTQTGDFVFNNGINFYKDSMFIHANALKLNTNTEKMQVNDAHFVDSQSKIHAIAKSIETVDKTSDLFLKQAIFSTCPPQNRSWYIKTSGMYLDKTNKSISASDIRFYVYGVPVFYFPWFKISLNKQRTTGFLTPYANYSSTSGFEFSLPFYINIHPQFDATFTPKIISKRGTLLNSEFRYLLTPRIYGEFRTGFMPSDKISDIRYRWYINTENYGYLGDHFRYRFDFSQTKDTKFSRDISLDDYGLNSSALLQMLELTSYWKNWSLNLRFKGYQNLGDSSGTSSKLSDNYFSYFNLVKGRTKKQGYFRLPQLWLEGREYLGAGLSLHLISDISYFNKLLDRNLSDTADLYIKQDKPVWDSPSAFRIVVNPKLLGDYRNDWGYIKPQIDLSYAYLQLLPRQDASLKNYQAQIDKKYRQIHKILPSFAIDMALTLDKYKIIGTNKYIQSLTPRIYLAYAPYINNAIFNQDYSPFIFDGGDPDFSETSLFSPKRLTGFDRFGDNAMLTLALNSKLQRLSDANKVLNLDIIQGFYFTPRRIGKIIDDNTYNKTRYLSPFIAKIDWRIVENLDWTNKFYFDWQSINNIKFIERAESNLYWKNSYIKVALSYAYASRHDKLNNPINDNWSYKSEALHELSSTGIFNLSNNWRLFGKYVYNLVAHLDSKRLFGLEYNNCCWQFQLVYADNLASSPKYDKAKDEFSRPERDYSFIFNLSFKGLGNVGENVNKYLNGELWAFDEKK